MVVSYQNHFMRTIFAAVVATPVLAFTTTVLISSCRFLGGERIRGNGNVTTSQRNVGNFNSVEANGAVEVHVKQDAATSVKVETDENLSQYLDVFTEGNTLVIRPKKGFNLDPTNAVLVYVTAPTFKSLEANGATKLVGDGAYNGEELELSATGASEINMDVKVSKIKAEASGASTLALKGNVKDFSSQASGASHLRCRDLETDETTVDVSGASGAEVNVGKQLNVEASGASNVKYRGSAAVNQKSTGASSVEKEG